MTRPGGNAKAADGVDEALFRFALVQIDVDQPRDDIGHVVCLERGADDLADGAAAASRIRTIRATHRNLVPLLAILVDAEDADVAGMVVAAGIHAAGNIDVQLADIVQEIEVVEAMLDGFSDRDGFRVRERAEIPAGTGDDVGQQSEVRRA